MVQRRTILLIEDEGPNRALARAVLARSTDPQVASIVLLEAPNLARAREILACEHVDLVLLDVRLPDGDGLSLAAEIHEQAARKRPVVVVLSASVLPSERDAALRSGADAFLAKPYHPAELVATVARLFEQKTAEPA
jgi:two-component system, OmpR family, KDP operon response regulator KdpE